MAYSTLNRDTLRRYVSTHAVGEDPLGERLEELRRVARIDVLRWIAVTPLSVLGTVSHAPIAALSVLVGKKMGVTKDGDTSVEATMRVIGATVGLLVYYPTVAAAVAVLSGGSGVAAVTAVAVLAASGYTAAVAPPATWQSLTGSFRILTKSDNVDKLRVERAALQEEVREFADKHAPPHLRGWWRDPNKFIAQMKEARVETERKRLERYQVVTLDSIRRAQLQSLNIPLTNRHTRSADERAVLTFKQAEGNRKALVWIPGRNDSFFHIHVLDRLLATGFDVFALDLRRCGRARWSASGAVITPEVEGHDSYVERVFEIYSVWRNIYTMKMFTLRSGIIHTELQFN